jgi:hypothetical protein
MLESPRVRRVTGLLFAFVSPYSNLEVTSAVLREAGRRENLALQHPGAEDRRPIGILPLAKL